MGETNANMEEELKKFQEDLEKEKEERNYFQLERVRFLLLLCLRQIILTAFIIGQSQGILGHYQAGIERV